MKPSSLLLSGVSVVLFACLVACNKEVQPASQRAVEIKSSEMVWRPYKDTFDTYYIVKPDFENGAAPETNFLPAWFPGGGEGNATHMGKAYCYFNQYTSFGPGGLGSVPAPVSMFFETELASAGITDVPFYVNNITYDKKGNSIWFQGGQATTVIVSETRINFNGKGTIVGGTGKFKNATGSVVLYGYFNPQDPSDAGFGTDGTIRY
ncbi:MAG: hypothetical protein V4717_15465 [Bacteroidota bacterium]